MAKALTAVVAVGQHEVRRDTITTLVAGVDSLVTAMPRYLIMSPHFRMLRGRSSLDPILAIPQGHRARATLTPTLRAILDINVLRCRCRPVTIWMIRQEQMMSVHLFSAQSARVVQVEAGVGRTT